MRVVLLALATALVLTGCGQDDPFAELPPREVPDSIEALAVAEGWEATDGGVLAGAGDTATLALPPEDAPAEVTYHLDRVEADGTVVETVDIVGVSVLADGTVTETITLPDATDVHYTLFAEVGRADGTRVVHRDWLYAR
ncbi:MAG: hypothetical protein WD080_02370 [Egibacteraceae bacterium]